MPIHALGSQTYAGIRMSMAKSSDFLFDELEMEVFQDFHRAQRQARLASWRLGSLAG